MVMVSNDIIALFVQLAIVSFILGLFIYRRFKNKINGLNWFIFIFLFTIFRAITEIVTKLMIEQDSDTYAKYGEIHFVVYSIVLLILFFFVESLEQPSPRFWLSSLIFLVWGVFITVYFYDLILSVEDGPYETHSFSIWFDIFQLIVVSSALVTYYKISRRAIYEELKRISMYFTFAFVGLVLISIQELTEPLTGSDFHSVYVFAPFFVFLAGLFLVYPYYVYVVPYDVYRLILLNKNGLMIHSCRFEQTHTSLEGMELLLGGSVNALEGFLQSIFETKNRLKSVDLDDRSLILVEDDNLKVLGIVEKTSYVLKNAIKQYLREVKHEFPALNKDNTHIIINEQIIVKLTEIISRCFPFIQSKDVFSIDLSLIEKQRSNQ
jgi:hypothetical protein